VVQVPRRLTKNVAGQICLEGRDGATAAPSNGMKLDGSGDEAKANVPAS
jgi:hypothetical protein